MKYSKIFPGCMLLLAIFLCGETSGQYSGKKITDTRQRTYLRIYKESKRIENIPILSNEILLSFCFLKDTLIWINGFSSTNMNTLYVINKLKIVNDELIFIESECIYLACNKNECYHLVALEKDKKIVFLKLDNEKKQIIKSWNVAEAVSITDIEKEIKRYLKIL